MKALSLTQPWASLVVIGAKRIETRSWYTSYRGPLAIHASKGFPKEARELCWVEPFMAALKQRYPAPILERLPVGEVLAIVQLVDCKRIGRPGIDELIHPPAFYVDPRKLGPEELEFGDYTSGRFAWLLTGVQLLNPTVPARGMLGLWEWNPLL